METDQIVGRLIAVHAGLGTVGRQDAPIPADEQDTIGREIEELVLHALEQTPVERGDLLPARDRVLPVGTAHHRGHLLFHTGDRHARWPLGASEAL
jgi:hypothetical protein